jgi:hypothetical protein
VQGHVDPSGPDHEIANHFLPLKVSAQNPFPGRMFFPLHPGVERFKKNGPLANRRRNAENE